MTRNGLNSHHVDAIANALEERLKLRIRPGPNWAYDYTTKTLYFVKADLVHLNEFTTTGMILHEAGHAKFTETFPNEVKDQLKFYPKYTAGMHYLFNVVEDERMEDVVRKEYPYAKDFIPENSAFYIAILEDRMKEFSLQGKDRPKLLEYLLGACFQSCGKEPVFMRREVEVAFDKTREHLKLAAQLPTAKEMYFYVEEYIAPHIEEFLKEYVEPPTMSVAVVASRVEPTRYPKSYEELKTEVKNEINTLQRQITAKLRDNRVSRLMGKYRTGKLNERKLYRHALNDTRLFQKKIVVRGKDYAIGLIVDQSGSMNSEDKILHAARATVLFAECLKKTSVPFGIMGFNHDYSWYKKFNQTVDSKVKEEIGQITMRADKDTCDGVTIQEMAKHMAGFGGKKIIMVITDGDTGPCGLHQSPTLHEAIRAALRRDISVMGIGIGPEGMEAVGENYPNSVTVPDVTQLPGVIGNVLREVVR